MQFDGFAVANWNSSLPYNQPISPFGIPGKERLELITGSFSQAYPVKEARCFDDLLTAIDEAEEKRAQFTK